MLRREDNSRKETNKKTPSLTTQLNLPAGWDDSQATLQYKVSEVYNPKSNKLYFVVQLFSYF
jgi:hypothetical protein